MPSATVEDYIKRLHHLQTQAPSGALIPFGQLSAAMNVVPGTVTTMVKTLADAGLVIYEPRRGVRLTPHGEKLALHVLRRHRLIELFLVKTLGLDWSEVHEEAEALEHVISDKVLERLDTLLGHPDTDPHGDPIPTAAGHLPTSAAIPLSTCPPGQLVTIERIDNTDPAFLRFAQRAGLTPGASLTLLQTDPDSQSLTLALSTGPTTHLGTSAANRIWVTA